jgi:thiol-disulfide isomerase/thioredoxin
MVEADEQTTRSGRSPAVIVAIVLSTVLLGAIVVIGLMQAGGEETAPEAPAFDLPAAQRQLAGAPAPLAALHAQANQLLPGGRDAFRKRIAQLGGHPVVINKWASWCGPCQAEFPIFQSVGTQRGKEIAFLGVNGTDKDPAARRFLDRRPLPFPSYTDPDEAISEDIKAPKNYPITVFIDRSGETAYIHTGQYRTEEQLNADIDRYLQ